MTNPVTAPMGGDGAVPPGITVVEASAGTGKTHRVTTVVLTELANGTPFDQMLLVTFTTKATSELRDRTWRRLSTAVRAMRAFLDIGNASDDDLHRALCEGARSDVVTRLERLQVAMADFDAATIATIHAFCQQVLRTVGFAADVDRDSELVDDDRALIEEVVDDLIVQRLHRNPDVDLTRRRALDIASKVTTNPLAPLLPEGADRRSPEGLPVSFGNAVRRRVGERKRMRRLLGYDDLLERVAAALVDDERGVRRRLREKFRLVVVDEFQDTDAVQWAILRDAFGGSDTKVVLVGDPKQAIYAFRGADVHAYLAASALPGHPLALDTNHRSDADLLAGLDLLFDGVDFGAEEIRYRSVRAVDHHVESRLRHGRRRTPIRLRMVKRGGGLVTTRYGIQKDAAIAHIAADLAADVVRVLTDGTEIVRDDGSPTLVRPNDVAVLVRRNDDALAVRDALVALGVPAVVNGAGSVHLTPAADDWRTVLDALDQPASRPRARAAALTSLLGWRAADIDAAGDATWDRLHGNLHDWRATLLDRGVAPLFTQLGETPGIDGSLLGERLLASRSGDRTLTDLRHLVQLLHEAGAELGSSPTSLLAWLRERRREAATDSALDDRSRRLDTDQQAVQVWTVHRSKGQEFPIVYAPYLWMSFLPSPDPPHVFHDPERGERVIDVGGGHGSSEHRRLAHAEAAAEELRVAYVALTRAAHQVVLWWTPVYEAERSALAHLLFGRRPGGADLTECPADDVAKTIALELARDSGGAIEIEDSEYPVSEMDPYLGRPEGAGPLDVRRFQRPLDRLWRRTSYSALTAAAHDALAHQAGQDPAVAPEHDERGLEDEWMPEGAAMTTARAQEVELRAVLSPFGDIGGGARFGTLVHSVLEHVDFTEPDLDRAVRDALATQHHGGHDGLDTDRVVAGLVAAIETPLGPLVDGLRLRDLDRSDRLDELHFELPIVGGDEPTGALDMADLAAVVRSHLAADPVLHGYGELLADPVLATATRGYLSGSIDVVMRTGGRYVVIDHKSNWLGVEGEVLSAWHYRPDAVNAAMIRSHYPLQAMLYAVALHRYLRWRLADYDPDLHLGGVLYLFLRGMTGPDAPVVDGQPCGVFSWHPPAALITDLSDLFAEGAP